MKEILDNGYDLKKGYIEAERTINENEEESGLLLGYGEDEAIAEILGSPI